MWIRRLIFATLLALSSAVGYHVANTYAQSEYGLYEAASNLGVQYATPATHLSEELWRVAVDTGLRIGFEAVDEPMKGVYRLTTSRRPLKGTAAEEIDAVIGGDERYEWRMVDGVAVVRPKSAWTDASDPLNRPVRGLRADGATVGGVLVGLQELLYNNRFQLGRAGGDPLSLHIQNGTVLNVLNELTRAAEQVMWVADYRPNDPSPLKLWVRGPTIVSAWAATPVAREHER